MCFAFQLIFLVQPHDSSFVSSLACWLSLSLCLLRSTFACHYSSVVWKSDFSFKFTTFLWSGVSKNKIAIIGSLLGSPFWEHVKEILNPETSVGAEPWVYYSIYAFFVFLFNIFDIVSFSSLLLYYWKFYLIYGVSSLYFEFHFDIGS